MAKSFFQLTPAEQRRAIIVATGRLLRSPMLVEKDAWVVWILAKLFESPLKDHLVLKGGTSLSKAHQVIQRFSEDVDLSYDVRAFAPELVLEGDEEALPRNRSQEKTLSRKLRKLLPEWVHDIVQPIIADALAAEALAAAVRVDGEKMFVDYEATVAGTGYVKPSVKVEFYARSTGEPASFMSIACDAEGLVEGVLFPTIRPRVLDAERTFWEKVSSIHAFCLRNLLRGERYSRHWHDIVRLFEEGIAHKAIADRELANAVARHKGMFHAMKAADGSRIDFVAAVNGGLRLVPGGEGLRILEEDYGKMIEEAMFLDVALPFDKLMESCGEIAELANRVAQS